MDNILLTAPTAAEWDAPFSDLQQQLTYNSVLAPKKIQANLPIDYFGYCLSEMQIRLQKLQIRKENLKTLNDFQKVLGDINWLRPALDIPTYTLQRLFSTLEGDSSLTSPGTPTPQAEKELQFVEQRLTSETLTFLNLSCSIVFYVFHTPHSSSGCLGQENGILKWLFLPNQQNKKLTT